MRRAVLWGVCLLVSLLSVCAQVSGHVVDIETNQPIAGVMIKVYQGDKMVAFSSSKSDGTFSFPKAPVPCVLTFKHLSYEGDEAEVVEAGDFVYPLTPTNTVLESVVVEAPRIVQRGDTTTYHLGRFVSKRDLSVADALKRLPGVEVSKVGTVSYLGKQIDKLTIDGLDMLGSDYQSALKSLSHQSIAKVEIMECQQEVKMLKELVGDDKIVMNLVLNRNARGKLNGRGDVGIGDDRQEVAYLANTNMLYFRPKFQLNFEGNLNRNFDGLMERSRFVFDELEPSSPLQQSISGLNPPLPPVEEQHFARKQSGKGVLNGVYQFRKDHTLRAKLSYSDQTYRDTYGNDITYLGGEEMADIELQEHRVETQERMRVGRANVRYFDNRECYFLTNQTDYVGHWTKQRDQIERLPQSVTQEIGQQLHLIENQTRYGVRKGQRVWAIDGTIRYQNFPLLSLVSEGIDQRFREETLGGGLSTSLLFVLPKSFRLTIPISLGLKCDQVGDLEQRFFGEQRISLSLTPTLARFEPGLSDLSLKVPMQLLLLEYDRPTSGDKPSFRQLLFSPELSYMYRINSSWSIDGQLAYRQSVGGMADLLDVPYYTSYRTLWKGSGELGKGGTATFRGNLKLRKPMQELYGTLDINATYTHSNQLYGDRPDREVNQVEGLMMDHEGYSLFGGADASKYFRKARTRVGMSIRGSWSSSQSSRYGLLARSEVVWLYGGGTIISELSKYFELSYRLNGSRRRLKYGGSLRDPIHSLNQSLSVTYTPTDYLFFTLGGEHQVREVQRSDFSHVFMLNGSAEYKVGQGVVKVSLYNLLNQQEYRFVSYNPTLITSTWYRLRGFTGLLSYTFYF